MPDCGEYAAVQAHRKAGEPLDDACRAAENRYAADNRLANPSGRRRSVRRQNAIERVRHRVANRHPLELKTALAFVTGLDREISKPVAKRRAYRIVCELNFRAEYEQELAVEFTAERLTLNS